MPGILFITFNYDEIYHPKVNGDIDSFNEVFNLIRRTNYKPLPPLNSGNNKLIKQKLLEGAYKIIHFSLHGTEDSMIQMTDHEKLSHEDFINLFDNELTNKVIILNICYSDELAKKIYEKTKCRCWVLGWKGKVSQEIVSKNTSSFYSKVLNGRKISKVLKEIKQENKEIKQENLVIFNPKHQGKIIRLILILLVSLVVVASAKWLIKPDKEKVNISKISNQPVETDSIKIIFPLNGDTIDFWDTVKVTAFLQPNLKPWIFIYSKTQEGWFPQEEGKQINNEWEFNISIGNIKSSEETKIIACIIDSLIETKCKHWLGNRTIPFNDSTFNENYIKFKADTITVNIK